MGRIECETAAQCQEIAAASNGAVEAAIPVLLVASVVVAVATVGYFQVVRDE